MSCGEIEEKLARYASGDMTKDEEFVVEVHLSACGDCRESLELYQMLESGLVARAKERPSSRAASRRIVRRLREEEYEPFAHSLWTAPAIIGAVVAISIILTIGVALLGGDSAADAQRIPGLTGIERFFTVAPDWIAGIFGGEAWLMLLVYGLMAIGFVLTGGFLAFRYVRD